MNDKQKFETSDGYEVVKHLISNYNCERAKRDMACVVITSGVAITTMILTKSIVSKKFPIVIDQIF